MHWRKKRNTEEDSLKVAALSAPLPHTDQEQNRLYFQHHMMRIILGGNIMAPLAYRPQRILDVGCHMGQWVLEVATEIPEAFVLGIDLEVPQLDPEHPQFPSNCLFAQQNILEPLPYRPQSFDYIHLRFVSNSIPAAQWQSVLTKLIALLRPGGWLEWVESGPVIAAGPASARLCEAWEEFGRQRGYIARPGVEILNSLRLTPLVNVAYYPVEVPIGAYGDRIGKMTAQDGLSIFNTLRPGIVGLKIMTAEEYQWCMEQAQFEVQDPRSPYRAVWGIAIACGQRGEEQRILPPA